MDFFASQDRAEKQTRLMLLLFALAVMAIVLSINLVGAVIYVLYADVHASSAGQTLLAVPGLAYGITTVIVLAVIAIGTITRMSALSGGGAAVAEMVGARLVKPDGSDLTERRLVNVVEEMAIAAGIRMPLVYVMDDQSGINAFAAGYSSDEAALTVTQGALDRLSRDELQGVVAHEFSHILNGDMRLNIRLVGVIAGIVTIGGIGRFLMNLGSGGDNSYSRKRGDARLFFLGLVIWLIGSIGVLFGSLIRAAVSRQREFLADASAVQFTRNPEGIAGALYKISLKGSGVFQRYADELSHMYFGAAASDFFATHPPVEERITRIMGPGAIRLLQDRIKAVPEPVDKSETVAVVDNLTSPIPAAFSGDGTVQFADYSQGSPSGAGAASDVATRLAVPQDGILPSVGTLSPAQVNQAQQLIDQLPAEVRRALRTGAGAKAALLSLVLDQGEARTRQLQIVATQTNHMIAMETKLLADMLQPLGIAIRMPVFDLALPSLRLLDEVERKQVIDMIEAMIRLDNKVTLGEFVLLILCRNHLQSASLGSAWIKHRTLQGVSREVATILSLLLHPGKVGDEVYARIVSRLALVSVSPVPVSGIAFPMVESALGELRLLAPQVKAAFIEACMEIVVEDGSITVTEGELIRAICAALDIPLPLKPFAGIDPPLP